MKGVSEQAHEGVGRTSDGSSLSRPTRVGKAMLISTSARLFTSLPVVTMRRQSTAFSMISVRSCGTGTRRGQGEVVAAGFRGYHLVAAASEHAPELQFRRTQYATMEPQPQPRGLKP